MASSLGEAGRPPIILASGSAARARMLLSAGVPFEVMTADVNEAAILEHEGIAGNPAFDAILLAKSKAFAVSRQRPDALVIGADQVLALDNAAFTKAADVAAARNTLSRLRGHTHLLYSAYAIFAAGEHVGGDVGRARMTMRAFTDEFLDRYIATAGTALTTCVGCYEYEGLGIQLFDQVVGDYYTILGMPLLKVLASLRELKALSP